VFQYNFGHENLASCLIQIQQSLLASHQTHCLSAPPLTATTGHLTSPSTDGWYVILHFLPLHFSQPSQMSTKSYECRVCFCALCPFSPPFNCPDKSCPQPLTAISVDMGCIDSCQHPLSQSTVDCTCQPHQDGCYRVHRIGFGGGSDTSKCSGAVSGSGVDVKSRPHSAHGPASTSYASVGVS
jgi:hypothetical protein